MNHIYLFEFTDLPWYPQTFRRIQTDYLQFVANLGSGHKNLVPLFKKALQYSGTTEIIDLCSGGSGPWMRLQQEFKKAGLSVNIKLTDKYPDPKAIQKWAAHSHQGIEYPAEPVDALNVPSHLNGLRTFFESFHHFKPQEARSILLDAAEKREAIGIFEASFKKPMGSILLLTSPLTTLLDYIFMTPFITPRTFSRFFWTYLVPVVPLATCWDGVVSMLRVFSLQELKKLTDSIRVKDYAWETGESSTGTPIFTFIYLIGYPL